MNRCPGLAEGRFERSTGYHLAAATAASFINFS